MEKHPSDSRLFNFHLISDATGETLNSLSRGALAQFGGVQADYHRWSLIRSEAQLKRVIEGIEKDPGPVLSTLVEQDMRNRLEMVCQKVKVPYIHVLDPVLGMLETYLGQHPRNRPGSQYVLDEEYFDKIDAIHYVLSHDDGQIGQDLRKADVVLVGVSRSSKTPTCFYLANKGIKAANIPLIPGVEPPEILFSLDCPIVGLTIDPAMLIEIRRHRLQLIGAGNIVDQPGENKPADYTDPETVKKEILAAKRLCVKYGWPVLDVTHRSIEEISVTIMQLMERFQQKKQEKAQRESENG